MVATRKKVAVRSAVIGQLLCQVTIIVGMDLTGLELIIKIQIDAIFIKKVKSLVMPLINSHAVGI